MSKEFEEIVLKKLDTLENKTTNTDKVMQEIVLKKLDTFEKQMQDNNKRLENVELELKVTQESLNNLNNNFTVFDFEINKKIDTLFDAITANNEKHDVFEKSIVSLNTKTFNHDIRISVLEDNSKNSKLFATN